MRSLGQLLPKMPRGHVAEERITQAYQNTFSGEDGHLVLADLCNHCKMFENVPITPGIDMAHVLVDFNARRSVYGRILQFLRLTGDEMTALERAAAVERRIDLTEGSI